MTGTLIYTQRFVNGRSAPGTWHTIWVVPAGGAHVLRDIILGNLGNASQHIALALIIPPAPDLNLLWAGDIASGLTVHIELRQALLANDALQLYSAAEAASALVTGYAFA